MQFIHKQQSIDATVHGKPIVFYLSQGRQPYFYILSRIGSVDLVGQLRSLWTIQLVPGWSCSGANRTAYGDRTWIACVIQVTLSRPLSKPLTLCIDYSRFLLRTSDLQTGNN